MLVIPNTTTTANETDPNPARFPSTDSGALTPFSSGFLFVANASAQISILRGPTAGQAQWTPYALVSPTMVPIGTDRLGRARHDLIFGVKAIDGVAGSHAQVFGALFQAGEAAFVPSAQFLGMVSSGGAFAPTVNEIASSYQSSAPATTGITQQSGNGDLFWHPGALTLNGQRIYLEVLGLTISTTANQDDFLHLGFRVYDQTGGAPGVPLSDWGNMPISPLANIETQSAVRVAFTPGAGTYDIALRWGPDLAARGSFVIKASQPYTLRLVYA